jgi:hypothetical protein
MFTSKIRLRLFESLNSSKKVFSPVVIYKIDEWAANSLKYNTVEFFSQYVIIKVDDNEWEDYLCQGFVKVNNKLRK